MGVDKEAVTVWRYNEIVRTPIVLAIIRHLSRRNVDFSAAGLIGHFAGLKDFPLFTARDLIAAAAAAGVEMSGQKIDLADLAACDFPFLTYAESLDPDDTRVVLVEVLGIENGRVAIFDGTVGRLTVTHAKLRSFWTGIVFTAQRGPAHETSGALAAYDARVAVLPDLLSPAECAELIGYCEAQAFRRSRVSAVDDRTSDQRSVVELKVRNSSSVPLMDRDHPLLARLYRTVAGLEKVDEGHIEFIQCVRYKKGQRFTSHFDASNGVPRRTTYLLYLNDDFDGGETCFTMLDRDIRPRTGSCLRFPSCDDDGRVCWQSEHGGLPVSAGVKYALNIWVHTPTAAVVPTAAATA